MRYLIKNAQVYFKLLILPGRQGVRILCGNVPYFADRKKASNPQVTLLNDFCVPIEFEGIVALTVWCSITYFKGFIPTNLRGTPSYSENTSKSVRACVIVN